MVDVSTIQALDHELPGEPEVVANLQRFLIDVLRREVLRDATVIRVAQLYFVVFVCVFTVQYLQGLEGRMESIDHENARLREENCLLRKRVEELTNEVRHQTCMHAFVIAMGPALQRR